MIYKFFDKEASGGTVKNEIISNEELAEGAIHKGCPHIFSYF